ncbi:hypothetical protein SAY86_022969, partial [Trapa natans]
AGSIHSGSISFGRFENETLCWEKRSSFSHNRYLEEVEKYSKPGSVNEKKAYFEAHFRKKLLLQQSPEDEETCTEAQNGEQDSSESMEYREEALQLADVDSHPYQFDESLISSEGRRGEPQVTSNLQVCRTAELPLDKGQGPDKVDGKEEASSEVICLSQSNDTIEITSRINKGQLPPKVADAVDLKERKDSRKSQPALAPLQKCVPRKTVADLRKKMSPRIGTPLRANQERSLRVISSDTTSVRGIRSSDDKSSRRLKVMPGHGSVGEVKGKKFAEFSPLAANKIEMRGASIASRIWPGEESKKPEANPRSRMISLKNSKHSHRSKQENAEAEIKQLRKSLNFKANPMPSFYHTEGNKFSRRTKQTQSLSESPPVGLKQSAPRFRPHSKPGTSSLSCVSDVKKFTSSLNMSSTGAINSKRDVKAVNVQRMIPSHKNKNEMPKKGTNSHGLGRTGRVAVVGIAY